MQETASGGWEPITNCYRPLSWGARLFLLYVIVPICIGVTRAITLAWRVVPSPGGERVPIRDANKTVEQLASAALNGRLTGEDPPDGEGKPTLSFGTDVGTATMRKLDRVDTEFSYQWERCLATAKATKRLARLTLLISFGITAWEGSNTLHGFTLHRLSLAGLSAGDVFEGLSEVFVLLAVGLLVSTFLYFIGGLFEGLLARRRTNWNYLRARIKDEVAASAEE